MHLQSERQIFIGAVQGNICHRILDIVCENKFEAEAKLDPTTQCIRRKSNNYWLKIKKWRVLQYRVNAQILTTLRHCGVTLNANKPSTAIQLKDFRLRSDPCLSLDDY